MSNQELQFKNGNPGAVQFGNFINYYEFNPPANRINLLPIDIWSTCKEQSSKTFLALDIGCNAGNLTHELTNFLQKHLPPDTKLQMLALDIDEMLIRRAREQYIDKNIQFQCCDTTQMEFQSTVHTFLDNYKRTKFDAVFCFSTTMWIHLNQGDAGLQQFLRDVCNLCEMFVVEPQPWKCYASAVKRTKKTHEFQHFKDLKMRFDIVTDIECFIIDQLGMCKVFESGQTEWKRKILCFKR